MMTTFTLVGLIASALLAGGGVQILRTQREDRLRGTLMIVAAFVVLGNVAIISF